MRDWGLPQKSDTFRKQISGCGEVQLPRIFCWTHLLGKTEAKIKIEVKVKVKVEVEVEEAGFFTEVAYP